MRTDVAAIILARGGSKGVPRKNLANVGGISLLARAIRTAQATRVRSPDSNGNLEFFPRVYVSTEDEQIALETMANGADLIQRPSVLATDTAQGIDALRHAVDQITDADRFIMVQCTAPLMTSNDIRETCHALAMGYDMTIASVPFHGIVVSPAGEFLTYDVNADENRQGQAQMQRAAGSVWAFHRDYLDSPWYSGRLGFVPSEVPFHLEIDAEEDLRVARLVVSGEQSERTQGPVGMLGGISRSGNGDLQRRHQAARTS